MQEQQLHSHWLLERWSLSEHHTRLALSLGKILRYFSEKFRGIQRCQFHESSDNRKLPVRPLAGGHGGPALCARYSLQVRPGAPQVCLPAESFPEREFSQKGNTSPGSTSTQTQSVEDFLQKIITYEHNFICKDGKELSVSLPWGFS